MTDVDEQTKYLAAGSLKVIEDLKTAQIREAQNRQKLYAQITAGTLTLSVSFLTFTKTGNLHSVNILVWSWIVLIFAIIFQLCSYIFVNLHFSKSIEDVRKWKKEGMDTKNLPDETNTWTKVTRAFNYTGYVFTISGLVLMVIFAIKNVN